MGLGTYWGLILEYVHDTYSNNICPKPLDNWPIQSWDKKIILPPLLPLPPKGVSLLCIPHFFWDGSETLGTLLWMYLTRIRTFMTRRNTLWKYLELTFSSWPLLPSRPQFLPNEEMIWRVYYLVRIEATVGPIHLWKLYPWCCNAIISIGQAAGYYGHRIFISIP